MIVTVPLDTTVKRPEASIVAMLESLVVQLIVPVAFSGLVVDVNWLVTLSFEPLELFVGLMT